MNIILILKIISGLLIVGSVVGLAIHFNNIGLLRNTVSGIKGNIKSRFEERKKKDIATYEDALVGTELSGFAGFVQKEENRYIYSGLEDTFKGLSITVYLVIKFLIALLVMCIAINNMHNILLGIGAGVITYLLFVVYETYRANRNYKAVDDDMAQFLNMLGNFQETEGRVSGVMQQIAPYMSDYLKEKLYNCATLGRISGDETLALSVLAKQIEHPRFKEVIRNLVNCNKYSADFASIVEGSKRILSQERKFKRERKVMGKEALINLIVVTIMLAVTWVLSARLTNIPLTTLLFGNMLGRICVMLIIAIYIIFAIRLLKENK